MQKARASDGRYSGENLSPRSRHLMALLPKPKTVERAAVDDLNNMQAQVAHGMCKIEQIQRLSSSFIKEHFDRIHPGQVIFRLGPAGLDLGGADSYRLQLCDSIYEIFSFFDLNNDERIDVRELRYAFSSMVTMRAKLCSRLQSAELPQTGPYSLPRRPASTARRIRPGP